MSATFCIVFIFQCGVIALTKPFFFSSSSDFYILSLTLAEQITLMMIHHGSLAIYPSVYSIDAKERKKKIYVPAEEGTLLCKWLL